MGGTIFLVDDNDALRNLAARVLRNAGYSVIEAANGEDALNGFDGHGHIDLLITDVVMPKIGGIELARRLCARDRNLLVLYMSGYSEAGLKGQDAPMPDAGWITKPFLPGQLLLEVRNRFDVAAAAARTAVGEELQQ